MCFIFLNTDAIHFLNKQENCIDCFQKAYALFTQEPPAFLFTIREQLSYICYYITENCQSEINAPSSYNFIEYQRTKQLLEYIHTQYNQPISLKSLALFANISERECFRCFQKILHTTPMTYITKYRISTALSLLQNTTLSITEIALSVGFNSSSYFSKIFREYMGSTPLQYRKNLSSRIFLHIKSGRNTPPTLIICSYFIQGQSSHKNHFFFYILH